MALDIMIGKAGDTLTGLTQTPGFQIATDLGEQDVPTKAIRRVHFKSPNMPTDRDQLWLVNADLLSGVIHNRLIAFKPVNGNVLQIPSDRISDILIAWVMGSGLPLTAP
ncbi:MAG TPA: hypothetical protein VMC86_02310 [Gemmatimonadales bacterium]|nr:hypothetical protein [Gemmatimonadales bacterium]